MDAFAEVPRGITNVARWEEQCRKIHARAKDFIDGKITLLQAAPELQRLALATLADKDPDLGIFMKICRELVGLPIGKERQYWGKHALEREDAKIDTVEKRWTPHARASAHRLVDRYRWALAARQRRRMSGHVV